MVTASPLRFPAHSLAHLSPAEAPGGSELWTLARLEQEGFRLGVLAVPAAVEDNWYRLNALPRRLAGLYRGLDPADPDDDILEEAWEEAAPLMAEAYLLDDVIDALLEAFAAVLAAPDEAAVVRRPGQRGEPLYQPTTRGVLLALKRVYREEWSPERVALRLARSGALALDPAPVVVHRVSAGESSAAAEAASRLAGERSSALVDAGGALVGVVKASATTS